MGDGDLVDHGQPSPAASGLDASETHFRRLLNKLPAAAHICNAAGLITYCNEHAVQLWGRTPKLNDPADRFCGSFKLYSSDGTPVPHDQCWMALALRNDREYDGCETVFERPDGQRRTGMAYVSPIRDEAGRLLGAVSVVVDISERKRTERHRAIQLSVSEMLAQASDIHSAATGILQETCKHLGWSLGVLWAVDRVVGVLRCTQVWHAPGAEVPEFEAACWQRWFAPGVGLPGRIWADNKPIWIADVVRDDNFPRAAAAQRAGLHSAFGYPITHGGEVLGVIEFFSERVRESEPELLDVMANVGGQIGQFLDRRRAAEALRDSEQRFRLVAERVPCIVWTAAPDGTITYANDQWFRYCGLTPDQNARHWPELVLHPDDRQRCFELWAHALQTGTDYEVEVRNRSRDGSYRWFVTRAAPLKDAAGRVVQWFGTTTDIDDRKRAEQTAQFLTEASAALAELMDYESTLQRVARLAVPVFADWCAVDILGPGGAARTVAVTHTDPDKAALAQDLFRRYPLARSDLLGIRTVLRTGVAEWAAVVPAGRIEELTGDPEQLRVIRELGLKSYICVPVRSHTRTLGALTFVIAESGHAYDAQDLRAAQDLASRAAIALENSHLVAALKESDRRKDEFLATLSHELRNPLAPISNAAQILRLETPASPDADWALGVIDRQTRHLTRLVDDLLDIARITGNKLELRKERVALADVLDTAVETSRPLIENCGQELAVTAPAESIYLHGDPVRLAQAISNLLNNAAKYTERGGRVWLSAERQRGDVVITVRDTGIGIPAELLPRVFDMFTQADRSLERSRGGLGIGLTLVQRLIGMHGGTVEARSAGPGTGSEFIIRLPAVPDDLVTEPAPAATEMTPVPECRILLVDDNEELANTMAKLLRLMGHDVHVAHDGLASLDAVAKYKPNLVLMDIGLPKLNGYEAARRIRERHGTDLVLIALTGWGQEDDRLRSRESGFDHHLTKPVKYESLEKLLADPVLSRRLRRLMPVPA